MYLLLKDLIEAEDPDGMDKVYVTAKVVNVRSSESYIMEVETVQLPKKQANEDSI